MEDKKNGKKRNVWFLISVIISLIIIVVSIVVICISMIEHNKKSDSDTNSASELNTLESYYLDFQDKIDSEEDDMRRAELYIERAKSLSESLPEDSEQKERFCKYIMRDIESANKIYGNDEFQDSDKIILGRCVKQGEKKKVTFEVKNDE